MSFSEWKEVMLQDVLKEKGYIRGPFGSTLKRSEMKKSGIPVYEQANAIDSHRHFRYFIDEEKYKSLKRFTVEENDLIISCSGTVGKISIIEPNDPKGIISQALLILRSDNSLIMPEYLYYFFNSREGINSIVSRSSGSVQVNIAKRAIIENISFKLPPLQEQKSIVNILSTLDEKIEVNNKINEALEKMAQEIFKHWFVDFEFPDEEGEPYKSSGGEMVESELGLIPKGWEVVNLREVIELHDSKRIPLSGNIRDKMDKIYPYYGAAALMDYVDDYIFDGQFVLLGEDGTVITEDGRPILQYVWGKIWVNNHAHVITGKHGYSINFIYNLLKSMNVSSIITGAVQKKINQGNLLGYKVILPKDSTVIELYSNSISNMYEDYRVRKEENNVLSNLRDTLLPKLMSGQIRVPLDNEEQ